jgi:glyoxylase-like metal-dependent hydrolase (beta-lactamase superfamily II)
MVASLTLCLGCTVNAPGLLRAPDARAVVTGGPDASMIFVARTSGGTAIVIDLGWIGAEPRLRAALAAVHVAPDSIAAVFLTHAHRDHIGAWRLVRQRALYLAADEEPRLFGRVEYAGWIPRTAEALRRSRLPPDAGVRVHTFSRDTAFVVGGDTVRAFLVPGHTPGSTAYLLRGILFAGDALSRVPTRGFTPARRGYSDDAARGARSLATLWNRLAAYDVRYVCTAHARCAAYSEEFRRDATR